VRDTSRSRRGVKRDTSSTRRPGGAGRSSHGFLAAIVAAAYTGFSPPHYSTTNNDLAAHAMRSSSFTYP